MYLIIILQVGILMPLKNKKFGLYTSPWMTIVFSLILMGVVIAMGFMNYNREKSFMISLLKDKGNALIQSFEAGERTGMMGQILRTLEHLQLHINETTLLPDISYISIVGNTGNIIAHSKTTLIGKKIVDLFFIKAIQREDETKWRIVTDELQNRHFEVYRSFKINIHPHRRHHMMMTYTENNDTKPNKTNKSYIFIGMNIQPFEEAIEEDLRHNIVMALIVFVIGMAGIVSLFWARNYSRSRQLLFDTQTFASEIISNMPVGIVVLKQDQTVVFINNVSCEILKTTEQESKGRSAIDILSDDMRALTKYITPDHRVVVKEFSLVSKNDKNLPVMVSATDILSTSGSFLGFLFVLKDLSEIRQLEIKNRKIEKLATIGNLATGIAHEVRNPLSSIKGYVTYFATLFEENSENKKSAILMAGEVDRVNRVISELLEFARPSNLAFKETDLKTLIEHSIKIVARDAKYAGVIISMDLPSDTLKMHVDSDKLLQVMLNLYINAIQSIKKDGKLKVRLKNFEGGIRINIKDTGVGIPIEDWEKIFDPYYTTKKSGTGLGLAIARKIIDDHDGSISVKSKPNQGTVFSIILPLKDHNGAI